MTALDDIAAGQQALLSLLQAQQSTNESLLSAIADLYSRLGGIEGRWAWTDTQIVPGTFHVAITSGAERSFTLATTDADGLQPDLDQIRPGAGLALMDDPGGPVTAFRSYIIATTPAVSNGTWVFGATRIATFGSQDIPTDGTLIKLILDF